jgi:hypothetical protein
VLCQNADGQEQEFLADSVVVATGGLSYPSTGSTGDGYRFGTDTGHALIETSPSLVPFEIKEDFCSRLQGLSLKNVSLTLTQGGKKVYSEQGEMLFTHFGISGPLVLTASCYLKDSPQTYGISLDLKPALSPKQLDDRILRDFSACKNRHFKNSLSGLLPSKLIPVVVERSGIAPDKQVNEITREERKRLVTLLKSFDMTLSGVRGYNEAIITRGGISVKDINAATMESKKVKGLFFAGEVLDLDAVTGGYNLQIAWSTGYLAGISVI